MWLTFESARGYAAACAPLLLIRVGCNFDLERDGLGELQLVFAFFVCLELATDGANKCSPGWSCDTRNPKGGMMDTGCFPFGVL